jgi:hypothetical protein
MPFEKFTKTGRVYIPKASIWSRGQIGLNQGAIEKFNLDDFNFAVLYYDHDEKKIGIQFTNEKGEGAIKLTKRKGGGTSISANAFLGYYDIEHATTKKYDVALDEESGFFVIQLK